ncbi:hypothetical protein KKA85_06610, partial [bacterium]|nr:hypothetical protein [bacterium]
TLTGTFGGFGKPAGGEDIEGTLFGAPGDEIPRIDVSVSPSYITLPPQASLQLLARVTGCDNRAVTWSLFPAGAGSLDGAGRYTAPGSAPDPPLVTITATSTVDIGASGDAAVNIEVPPPTCDFVHGNWEVHILIETADGFQDDCYDLAYWFFVQDECSLTLYDRGRQVELGMTGAYAQGVLQIPSAQYTYGLHFRDGVEIADGSGIEYLSLFEPTEPHYRPVLGFKLVTD